MPVLQLNEEQVLELLRQLSPEGRKKALQMLTTELREYLATMTPLAEHLRRWAKEQVIECAAVGGADYIVTGDRHLLALKSYGRI